MTDVAAEIQRMRRGQPHDCPSCNASRALNAIRASVTDLDAALEGFIEQSTDFEGSYYFLRDEIAAIAKLPLALPVRKRLLAALRTGALHR